MQSRLTRLLPLLGLYLGIRLFLLLTRFDWFALPVYEQFPVGSIAALASDGWRGAPLSAYFDNCGGHLLWGLVTAPFFKLFGSSYMVLKLVPLILGSIDLILIWDLSRRVFGNVAATVASLAFVFAPPTLLTYSILAKGNHFEGLTLQLLATWLWIRGCQDPLHESKWWAGAALTAGLAVFAYTGAALWLGLVLIAHLLLARRIQASQLCIVAVSFVVGLSPLIYLEYRTGRVLEFLGANLADQTFATRMSALLGETALASPGFAQSLESSGDALSSLWWMIYALAWGSLAMFVARRFNAARSAVAEGALANRARLLIPMLAYFPCFALCFGFSNFRFETYQGPIAVGQYRYLVPLFAFACVLFGAFAQGISKQRSLASRRLWISLTPVALGAVAFLGFLGLNPTPMGAGFYYQGFDHANLARPLLREGSFDPASGTYTFNQERLRHELAELRPRDQERVAFGLGRELLQAQRIGGQLATMNADRILEVVPKHLAASMAQGIGCGMANIPRKNGQLRSLLERISLTSTAHAGHVAEGLTSHRRGQLSRGTEPGIQHSLSVSGSIPAVMRVGWRRGQGEFCGDLLGRGFERDRALVVGLLATLPPVAEEPFWKGAEQAWARSRRRNEVFAGEREGLRGALSASQGSQETR